MEVKNGRSSLLLCQYFHEILFHSLLSLYFLIMLLPYLLSPLSLPFVTVHNFLTLLSIFSFHLFILLSHSTFLVYFLSPLSHSHFLTRLLLSTPLSLTMFSLLFLILLYFPTFSLYYLFPFSLLFLSLLSIFTCYYLTHVLTF